MGDTCRPCQHKFHMDPAFISVGDGKQVFGWGSVDSDWDGGCRWWEHDVASRRWPSNPALFDLQRALKPETGITKVMQTVFGMTALQDSDDEAASEEDDNTRAENASFRSVMNLTALANFMGTVEDDRQLFHINASGQTCFSAQEAAAASARLREIGFVDQLKDQVSKVPWQFPQSSEHVSDVLCNERIYGHANIVLVSGVVRLSPGMGSGEGSK